MGAGLEDAVFTVVDTETTGLSPYRDEVVEVACVRVSGGAIVDRFTTLVRPYGAIPARATAVHGITDADVRHAPRLEEVAPLVRGACANAVVVAHNAGFDRGFLPFLADRPWLCTMRLARRLVDAPNYRNATLAAFFGVEGCGREHSALGDALRTAGVLLELLRRYRRRRPGATVASLFALLEAPARPVRARYAWAETRCQNRALV